MDNVLTVAIFDDHELFRKGVADTLNRDPNIKVVAEGADANEALRLTSEYNPDIVLLDISMPGGGVSAAYSIQSECPSVNIAMLTVSEEEDDIYSAIRAGAKGYVLKGIGGTRLVEIVKQICVGETYLSPGLALKMLSDVGQHQNPTDTEGASVPELTDREEQILQGVTRGLSNKEIGEEINIREKTVKHYMTKILKKLNARNRVEAIIKARRLSR